MYSKLLKLTNGDNIIVTTEDACDTFKDKEFIEFTDPVQVGVMRFPKGTRIVETYILQPWIKFAVNVKYKLPVHNIIIATDLHDGAIEQYHEYLVENSNQEIQAAEQELDEQDYEDQENDPRDAFENFLNMVLNNESEEEDDDGNYRTRAGRTLH